MSTTKPDTETGWSKEWPVDADAFYWKRDTLGRYRDLPAHVDRDRVIGLFDHSYTPRGDIEGEIELLGPISPSDFEQLMRLRKIAEDALQFRILMGGPCGHEEYMTKLCTQCEIREALAHIGGES